MVNPNSAARMAGPNFPKASESKDLSARRLAVASALIAALAAAFSGWNSFSNYQRNQQMIKDKVFVVRAAPNWNITIDQIGGSLYRIKWAILTPTFQETSASFVDGRPIEIFLGDLETVNDQGTRYTIKNLQQLVCPPNHEQPKLTSNCIETPLSRIKIEFDVSGDPRAFVCRPGQCDQS